VLIFYILIKNILAISVTIENEELEDDPAHVVTIQLKKRGNQ
jgi:hypothetical protein